MAGSDVQAAESLRTATGPESFMRASTIRGSLFQKSPWWTSTNCAPDAAARSNRSREAETPQTILRTSGAPVDLSPAIRSTIAGVDPSLPIASMRTLEDVVDHAFGRPRFLPALLGTFAGIALGLMTVGVYGLYGVTPSDPITLVMATTTHQAF